MFVLYIIYTCREWVSYYMAAYKIWIILYYARWIYDRTIFSRCARLIKYDIMLDGGEGGMGVRIDRDGGERRIYACIYIYIYNMYATWGCCIFQDLPWSRGWYTHGISLSSPNIRKPLIYSTVWKSVKLWTKRTKACRKGSVCVWFFCVRSVNIVWTNV